MLTLGQLKKKKKKNQVESNGTVLSTNWKEVGAKKVEGTPPDGMEMKKWEYWGSPHPHRQRIMWFISTQGKEPVACMFIL